MVRKLGKSFLNIIMLCGTIPRFLINIMNSESWRILSMLANVCGGFRPSQQTLAGFVHLMQTCGDFVRFGKNGMEDLVVSQFSLFSVYFVFYTWSSLFVQILLSGRYMNRIGCSPVIHSSYRTLVRRGTRRDLSFRQEYYVPPQLALSSVV